MNKREFCPKCGTEMKLATSCSGQATGNIHKEKWICPNCRYIK